jgi:hypothetical protein
MLARTASKVNPSGPDTLTFTFVSGHEGELRDMIEISLIDGAWIGSGTVASWEPE